MPNPVYGKRMRPPLNAGAACFTLLLPTLEDDRLRAFEVSSNRTQTGEEKPATDIGPTSILSISHKNWPIPLPYQACA